MKTLATVAFAALLAGTGTYALAQQSPAPQTPPAAQGQAQPGPRGGMSQDDFNRLVDARIAAIKAGLKLSADQERLWGPVENAIRTSAAERFSRFDQRLTPEQRDSMDLMQRLERRSTMMTERAQRLSAVTTALRPLWDTFSADQKRIAPRLLREAVSDDGPRWHERGGRKGRQHGGMGMMGHGPMGGHGGMGPGGSRTPAPQQ